MRMEHFLAQPLAKGRSLLRVCCSANANASGLGLLQAAKPLQLQGGVQPRTGCKHPSKPKPLRATVAAPTDVLVELVVEQSPGLHPACLLPQGRPLSQEAAALLGLDGLAPGGLVAALAQVGRYLSQVSGEEVAAVAASPLFMAFLERSLEVVCERGMGPAAPVLLLRLLSMLRFEGAEPQPLRAAYANYYRHLANALEDGVKRDPRGLTPQAAVSAFNSWARIDLPGVGPLKSTAFALRVRDLVRGRHFGTEESAHMLCAMGAILRRPGVGYNPAAQDVAALAGTVTGHLPELRAGLLEELAWACGAFRWPAYVAQLGLLERIAEEAFRRVSATGEPRRSVGARMALSAALATARALRPSLGEELEARYCQHQPREQLRPGSMVVVLEGRAAGGGRKQLSAV